MSTKRKTITNTDYLTEDEARRLVKRLKTYLEDYKNRNNPDEALKRLLFTETKIGKNKKIPPLINYIEVWIKKALSDWGKTDKEYWPDYQLDSENNASNLYHKLPLVVENGERTYFKRDEIRQEILLILMEKLKENFTFRLNEDNFSGDENEADKENYKKAYHKFLKYIKENIVNEVLNKIIDIEGYRKTSKKEKNGAKSQNKYYQYRFICGQNENSSAEIPITRIDDYIAHKRNKRENNELDFSVISESTFNTPEEELIAKERKKELLDMVEKLPEKQRVTVEKYHLNNYGNLTEEEIALKENITQQAVSYRLQNAHEFLKEAWKAKNRAS